MISALTNIGLDLLFVIRFGMGVAGVAWATLIAQGVCAFVSFFVLISRLRRIENEPSEQGRAFTFFDASSARRIAKVGVPSMLQQSVVSVSMMMMQGLVNSYGKVFVAGYTASMLMVLIFSVFITVMIYLFGPQLLGLFLKQGTGGSAMSYGLEYMKTVSVFYILMGFLFVGNGLLRGAGDMGAFMLSSMSNLFVRVFVAYLLAHFIGASAIWWSIPTGWAVGAIFSFARVKSGKWMAKRLVK